MRGPYFQTPRFSVSSSIVGQQVGYSREQILVVGFILMIDKWQGVCDMVFMLAHIRHTLANARSSQHSKDALEQSL